MEKFHNLATKNKKRKEYYLWQGKIVKIWEKNLLGENSPHFH
jgi:hypothetical protein